MFFIRSSMIACLSSYVLALIILSCISHMDFMSIIPVWPLESPELIIPEACEVDDPAEFPCDVLGPVVQAVKKAKLQIKATPLIDQIVDFIESSSGDVAIKVLGPLDTAVNSARPFADSSHTRDRSQKQNDPNQIILGQKKQAQRQAMRNMHKRVA
jgi:hypothetical protein